MDIRNKLFKISRVTLIFDEKDIKELGKWYDALSSATKEDACLLVKDVANKLEYLLQKITTIDEEMVKDKTIRNRKCPSRPTTQKNKIKVTITNIDDNNVFQTVVRMLGRFVKCNNCMSIESQLRQDKGVIYLDNEQELNDLLDTLLAYNLSDNVTPIKIQVE